MNTTTAALQSIPAAARIGPGQSRQHGGCASGTDSDVVTMPDPRGMREFRADSASVAADRRRGPDRRGRPPTSRSRTRGRVAREFVPF